MTAAVMFRPAAEMISSSFFTLPDTLAWTGADRKPLASAIIWPTWTWSPTFTSSFAGAPMCMDIGITTSAGTGMASDGM